jgi:hypothetical protein
MFNLKKWDETQSQRSRHRFVNVIVCDLPPERVFDVVTSSEYESEWFPDFISAKWQTPPPHGPGSVRTYRLRYMTIVEEFLLWDRGVRLLFRLTKCSLPILRAFMESYVLNRQDGGGTALCWEVSYQPNPWLAFLHPVVRPWFAADFAKAARQLEALLQRLHDLELTSIVTASNGGKNRHGR